MFAVVVTSFGSGNALAATLAFEDFEGYTSFPTFVQNFAVPSGGQPYSGTVAERVNTGKPRLDEGAKVTWYGARFGTGDGSLSASSATDLAVQNYGSINRPDDPNANYTHTARLADDAGLVFTFSTIGYGTAQLSFDWRTYNVGASDRLRVGYRSGNPGFGSCDGNAASGCFANLTSGSGAWSSWTELTLSDPVLKGNNNSWLPESFLLPGNSSQIWVAFWLDGNDSGDNSNFGKFDNVRVTATATVPVPAAGWLLISAFCWMMTKARHRAA